MTLRWSVGLPDTAGWAEIAGHVEAARERLWALSTADIVAVLDALGQRLRTDPRLHAVDGLAYLCLWLRRTSLEELLALNLGDPGMLDGFRPVSRTQRVAAQPRGIASHWLAGNVATLGLFSLAQSWLARNGNVAKVPEGSLPFLVHTLDILNGITLSVDGRAVHGRDLAAATALVSFPSSDDAANRAMSLLADVKVVWGGKQAVEAILALPQKETCETVVFGPKYSLSVYDRAAATAKDLPDILRRTVADVLAFDQMGCSAPHTLFMERGTRPVRAVGEMLADAFRQAAARRPRVGIAPAAAIDIIAARARYALAPDKDILAPVENDWTILIDGAVRLEEPVFHRTLFLKEVESIEQVVPLVTRKVQTIGIDIRDGERRDRFCRAVTYRGAARCVAPGLMNNFDAPWDGLYFLDRLVRWVSIKEGRP